MKKIEKYLILVLCVIAFSAMTTATYFGIKNQNNSDDSNELIASKQYSNGAWRLVFAGMAIFGDGSIYTWNVDNEFFDDHGDLHTNDYNSLKKFILEFAQKEDITVSEKDLKQIKSLISLINEDSTKFESENNLFDAGEHSIYVYKNQKIYLIDQKGDLTGTSKDKNAQKLIKIIKQYNDKINNSKKVEAKRLIASIYYENYAWGYTFSGTAFFEDGSIYTWNIEDKSNTFKSDDQKLSEYERLKSFVLENAKKETVAVSDADLRKMLNYSSLIDENSTDFKKQNFGYDMGNCVVYSYHDGNAYLIDEDGDWTGTSSDINAQELIEIVKKYHNDLRIQPD